jgi:DNA-binding SARP family transcriptional activator/pimeloyl-ACP methyl ester carboxylesterase
VGKAVVVSVEKSDTCVEILWGGASAGRPAGPKTPKSLRKKLLQVSVLGNLAVVSDGAAMQLPPSRKTRALLAYLAVTARPHSRDRLSAMLWPVPDDPRGALRWSLSRLRPLVDEPGCRRIIADRESVGFVSDDVTVDILSLRNLARNGTDAMSTDVLREVTQALEVGFLEGLDLPDCHEFQSWCIGEREETRRLRVRLLTALVTRLEDQPDEALRHARTLSLLEPANESIQAVLIRLLRATGRWREAEDQFQSAQRRLEEFNVVHTGALRRAVQLPLQAAPPTRADDRLERRPHAERRFEQPASHEVQFCRTSDGVRIAYACVGVGPPVVWAAHWLSHLSFSWESPIWRHWTEEFAKDHAFVHYDERGNGLSDWDNPIFSVDAFVRDLEAVVDALGFDRFTLIGSSKGGSTAIAYAALHPERVARLVLYGTYAQGARVRGDEGGIETNEAMIALLLQGWAKDNPAFRQILTSLLLPDATVEEMGWFNDLQRLSASAENASRLLRSLGDVNVVDHLPGITAPTLVLHCRDDASVPFEQGRLIASRIPHARFIPLESRNHVLLPRDPAWPVFVREVRKFLCEGAPMKSPIAKGVARGR